MNNLLKPAFQTILDEKKIRLVQATDAQAIQTIYAPAVTRQDVATSFEMEIPTIDEIKKRITTKTQTYPWLVWEEENQLLGYAYGDPYRPRGAYQWCAEVTVYVSPLAHRKGIGKKLYKILFEIMRQQGIINTYAIIALPNPASIGLHESLGFKAVGVFKSVGYKFNTSHDVGWWHLALQEWPHEPMPIVPFNQLKKDILNFLAHRV